MNKSPKILLCSAMLFVLMAGAFAAFQAPPVDAAPVDPCFSCYFNGFAYGYGLTPGDAYNNAVNYAQGQCQACGITTVSTQKMCEPWFCYYQVQISYGCWQCIT